MDNQLKILQYKKEKLLKEYYKLNYYWLTNKISTFKFTYLKFQYQRKINEISLQIELLKNK